MRLTSGRGSRPVHIKVINQPPVIPPPIIQFVPQKQSTDKLAIWSLIVNAVLTFGTFLLYFEATHQSKIAQRSADAATAALLETRRSNDVSFANYSLAKTSFDSSQAASSKSYELSKQSLQAQIRSVKESENEFNKTTEPVLVCSNVQMVSVEVGKPMVANVDISCLKDLPVKLLSEGSAWSIGADPYNLDSLANEFNRDAKSGKLHSINVYVDKNTPYKKYSTAAIPLDMGSYVDLVHGKGYLYQYGFFKYQNLANNKIRYYWYVTKSKPLPNGKSFVDNLINENFDENQKVKLKY